MCCIMEANNKKKVGRPLINYVKCMVEKHWWGTCDHLVEHFLQAWSAHFLSHVPVCWVGQKKLPLGF